MEQKESSLSEVLLKSSSIIFALTLVARVFGYLFNSLLTKTVAPGDYGSYTFAWSIAMFASGLALLGINPAVGRYVAYYRGKEDKERLNSVIKTGLILVLLITSLSSIFLITANRLFPELLSLDRLLLLFALLVFATQSTGFFFMCVISGYRRPEVGTVFSTLFSAFSFFFVLLSAYFSYDFTYILFSILAAFLISNIGGAIYVLKYIGISGKFDFHMSKGLIAFGLPLVVIDTANNLLSWANIYVLKLFHGFDQIGIFSAATITANVILLFSQPVLGIFTPVVAEMYGKRELERLAFLSSYLFERVVLLSSPLLIIFLIFPEGILKTIFTANYAAGAVPLQILSVSVFLLGISMIFRTVITSSGKPEQEARIILVAAVVNVVLNILLVKPYGLIGAGVATFVSSLLILVLSFRYSRLVTKIIAYKYRLVKIGLSLLVSLICVYIVKLNVLNLNLAFIISIIVLSVSYILSLISLKALRSEDAVVLRLIVDKVSLLKKIEGKIFYVLEKGTS